MPKDKKQVINQTKKSIAVQYVTVPSAQSGRRLDNFLQLQLKGVPKTRIYQMIRKGEVRLNGSRAKQNQRIEEDDVVRIPPVRLSSETERSIPPKYLQEKLNKCIIHEDEYLLVVNKPSGLVVHSGSGQQFGVIDCLRHFRSDGSYLELAHRLDRDTSGCLILVKNPDILREVQKALKNSQAKKYYLTFVKGKLEKNTIMVNKPIKKGLLSNGERMVRIDPEGKSAKTIFQQQACYEVGSLLKVELLTGRTHQIRVHGAYLDHPIAMDGKYGNRDFNKSLKKHGLKRLFLHASEMQLKLSYSKRTLKFQAPLPSELEVFLKKLNKIR